MKGRLATPNLLEIAYLLERHHQIVDVGTATSWPYGIEELSVTLEGENIDLDQAGFLRHGKLPLAAVNQAVSAVQAAIWQKLEGVTP